MKTTLRLLSLVFGFVLAGLSLTSCVTTSASKGAHSIKTPYAAPKTYKTYAWFQTAPVAQPSFEKGYSASLDQNVVRAIEEELEKRGYRKASQNPDVLVAYDVSVSMAEETDKAAQPRPGFGYSYGYMAGYRYSYGHADMPGYRSVDLFKEGTLIIDLINPKSNMLLWRGWAEGGITNFKAGYGKVQGVVTDVMGSL
ncbi:DUF4136 domain-containing protein [Pontibacter sp. E15-1]|uniref:DUF4136 domain-containing protein n=1 Tax=Pontibacter sp. E15-1 TaxID=2919918 RepID=UPI001F4F7E1B|nr:DUF4136 domain-containing protein [Pontibacter sp. E15-1]MCJ8166319.1 DUF4136 domain-containing protein [Pontibacter sp. E15-1]